jgi:AbiV family abortive infection protein
LPEKNLGRARIIFDLRSRVVNTGAKIDIKEIETRCENHLTKQEWAQLSFTTVADNDTQIGKLLRKMITNDPQSPDFRQANADMEKFMAKKRKDAPKARHNERLKALYVEPNATGWNRPIEQVTKESAYQSIYQAVNDYALFLHGEPESKSTRLF